MLACPKKSGYGTLLRINLKIWLYSQKQGGELVRYFRSNNWSSIIKMAEKLANPSQKDVIRISLTAIGLALAVLFTAREEE